MNGCAGELGRYVLNGIAATGIHYGVLTFNLDVLGFSSAGLANLIAAIGGITASFFGSRYFVFCNTSESLASQALEFSKLYSAIAVLHGIVMLILVDTLSFERKSGFLIATALQVLVSYIGNKFLVFKT